MGFQSPLDTASYNEFQHVGDGTNNFLFNFSLILLSVNIDFLVLFHSAVHFPKELLYIDFLTKEVNSKCFSTSVLVTSVGCTLLVWREFMLILSLS